MPSTIYGLRVVCCSSLSAIPLPRWEQPESRSPTTCIPDRLTVRCQPPRRVEAFQGKTTRSESTKRDPIRGCGCNDSKPSPFTDLGRVPPTGLQTLCSARQLLKQPVPFLFFETLTRWSPGLLSISRDWLSCAFPRIDHCDAAKQLASDESSAALLETRPLWGLLFFRYSSLPCRPLAAAELVCSRFSCRSPLL
ncbi:uncharacterized protein EI97DRAFT_441844 [Westerdykella ornata]|uniref:Uncharacterized protein n=1 Tax=Westerdykella ornata TaxID=318751 RepID=A0A6A6JMB0_WESOR|nr:uncharacterized protein EI97DRAFT_441844 [Westerdykella ornata]KAF2277088.1 hypothetical protein EI97DRAFT_441844 [Westerdykella ornata]